MYPKIQFQRKVCARFLCVFSLWAMTSFAALAQAPAAQQPVSHPSTASGRTLVAGKDYLVLAKPVTVPDDRLEVAYFFWYNSPSSAKLDPIIRNWAATKASPFVKLRPMPAVLENKWGYGARVFFALQLLNREHDVGPKLMQALQQGVVDYNSPKSMSTWLNEQGVSLKAMNDAVNDPRVVAQTSWMPSIMRLYGVERVPTVLIDGQFLFVQDENEKPEDFMAKVSFASEALTQRKLRSLAKARAGDKK
jgi:hypothetical protein